MAEFWNTGTGGTLEQLKHLPTSLLNTLYISITYMFQVFQLFQVLQCPKTVNIPIYGFKEKQS
jgi:hypothetical protein